MSTQDKQSNQPSTQPWNHWKDSPWWKEMVHSPGQRPFVRWTPAPSASWPFMAACFNAARPDRPLVVVTPGLKVGSNTPKVPNVSQTPMGSADTPRKSAFAFNAIKRPSKNGRGVVLAGSEGHGTPDGKTRTGRRNHRLQNSQRSEGMNFGKKNIDFSFPINYLWNSP